MKHQKEKRGNKIRKKMERNGKKTYTQKWKRQKFSRNDYKHNSSIKCDSEKFRTPTFHTFHKGFTHQTANEIPDICYFFSEFFLHAKTKNCGKLEKYKKGVDRPCTGDFRTPRSNVDRRPSIGARRYILTFRSSLGNVI